MDIDEIIDAFSFLDDWEERYRYVIELGRELPPFPDDLHTDAHKVRGCVSQVWLVTRVEAGPDGPVLHFIGDSDALIVKGLVAIVLALFSGKTARTIVETDADAVFRTLGLAEHLTPQRSNGLKSMVGRIQHDAAAVLQV